MTYLIDDAINLKNTTKYHEPLIRNHLVTVQSKLSKIISDSDSYKNFYETSNDRYKINIATSPSACELIYAYHESVSSETKSIIIKALASNNFSSNINITKKIEKHNVDIVFVCDGGVEWSSDEISYKCKMIDLAYDFINKSNSNVYETTCSFVREIYLYKTNESLINSKSSHLSIGKIAMANFSDSSLLGFVEVLVHESFHSYLHSIEEMKCRFLNDSYFEKSEPEYIVSPWSGAKVDLWSYTHAILVWSYLHNFWVDSLSKIDKLTDFDIDKKELSISIDIARKGFIDDKAFSLLDSRKNFVNESYFHIISRLKEKDLYVTV
ncbi:hypothetical protein RGL59_000961 [Vibrio parahaemolyticus]|nr:hypothetical protein [Vibrio parahaemolyticus]